MDEFEYSLNQADLNADFFFVASTMNGSRAVERLVEPGASALCKFCGEPVKFTAKTRTRQVIANVYEKGTWNRVEHFHVDCYHHLGEPYGQPAA